MYNIIARGIYKNSTELEDLAKQGFMPKSEPTGSFFISMGYKTLFIQESQKMSLYLDNIVVETKAGEVRFLIKDLKIVIVDNYKCSLSVQLINKLTENNVALVLCDLSHKPFTQLIPLNGNYAQSGVIKKQIEWRSEMKELLHSEIVRAKINSQISILKKNNRKEEIIFRLKEYASQIEIADATNREGLAAKAYFRELFGPNFIRFDEDIINAGLNYGYTVFRTLISSVAVSKGLLLNLGIYHKGIANSANLSDDIIEVFRPIVDDYVFNNLVGFGEEILTRENRESLIKLVDIKIQFNGQFQTVSNTISMYIDSIMKCFEQNDINEYNSPALIFRDDYDV